jgi:hypothetical protein
MISSADQREQIIQALKSANGKYAKPFEKGKMAMFSAFGGNWENYAQIVMSMVIADTLLSIEARLGELNAKVRPEL